MRIRGRFLLAPALLLGTAALAGAQSARPPGGRATSHIARAMERCTAESIAGVLVPDIMIGPDTPTDPDPARARAAWVDVQRDTVGGLPGLCAEVLKAFRHGLVVEGSRWMCAPIAACQNDEIWNFHDPELVLVLAPVVEVVDQRHRPVGRLRRGMLIPRCEPSYVAAEKPSPWTCVIADHERRLVRTADVHAENEPIVRLYLVDGRWYIQEVTRPD